MARYISNGFLALFLVAGCASTPEPVPEEKGPTVSQVADFVEFVNAHTKRASVLEKSLSLAYWEATTTGDKQAYEKVAKLEIELKKLHSDPKHYEFLKLVEKEGVVEEPLRKRQLTLLVSAFEENQISPELLERTVRLSTGVQKTFSDFRGQLDGKPVTDNQLIEILRKEKDSVRRKRAWEAYKAKGPAVRDTVLELVGLRNQAAKILGYANYYEMSLRLMEQDPARIQAIFDELAKQTDEPFRKIMDEVNSELSRRYGVPVGELRPWHYEDPFFQRAPTMRGVDLDPFFGDRDPRDLTQAFFDGIGLAPGDILARSDLYEKPGKMPHAYCTHIDRSGDVRILANLQNNAEWNRTLLHEMGHAVYDRYLDMKLPWLLRQPAHPFATEAIAMLFDRQTRNPKWLEKAVGVEPARLEPLSADLDFSRRLSMLVFARWAMVMMNFERQLYTNPEQDLNKLWWGLKRRYQLIAPPEERDAPDWASKIHIAVWPAYYHNYLLGSMMASQLLATLAREVLGGGDPNRLDLVGRSAVGAWFKTHIFERGASLRWDELLVSATGETLNPKYFADQVLQN